MEAQEGPHQGSGAVAVAAATVSTRPTRPTHALEKTRRNFRESSGLARVPKR